MVRRQMDFSWPLIVVLVGLFFLSLKLPRQWERIARPTALVLKPDKSLPAKELASARDSQRERRLPEVFRSIEPAGHVARNSRDLAVSLPRPAAILPVAGSKSPVAVVVPVAAPVKEPAKIVVAAEKVNDRPADKTVLPAPIAVAQPILPRRQVAAKEVAFAVVAKTDPVRALRDVPEALPGSKRGPDGATIDPQNSDATRPTNGRSENRIFGHASCCITNLSPNKAEPEVDRLAPLKIEVVQVQSAGHPSEDPDAVRQPLPSNTIPVSSVTVESSPAIAETVRNPMHVVVPEPQLPVMGSLPSANPQPALPDPDMIVATDGAKPADIVKPVEKADATVPPASESAAAQPSMETIGPMSAIGRAWEEPAQLLTQLEELKTHEATQEWAGETSAAIGKLGPAIAVGTAETPEILQHLEQLSHQAPSLLTKVTDRTVAAHLSGTAQALERRVKLWKQIGRMGGMIAANAPAPAVDPRSFNKCLNDIDQLTGNSPEGHAWRKYMLIDSLHDWAARHRNNDERLPHDLAQQVLKRFSQMSVTSHQRQFLTSGPMAALHQEMVRHTAEAVESNRLLQHLESYEKSGLPSDARMLAQDCQFLGVSSAAAQRELGDLFEVNYRNANLRIAVTAELLNLMIPKREPEYAAVQDTIQNVPVRGQSLMSNEVTVHMIPDPWHARLALEVNGEVASLTHSSAGPATFYSDSESSYVARKPLEISLRGIRMGETEVFVDNNSQLRSISTRLDGVPLFGSVVRNVAQSQYNQKAPAADAEVREKIAIRAKERVDHETTEQVSAAAKRLQDEVLGPLYALLLDPKMIAAETTEKRFSMRIRLAGPDQLGGHTPRPLAPADSLASVQIHESMLNNMLERLEFDGQTFDLAGLGRRLAERFPRYQPKPVDPDQADVKITFAAKDAIHVRCSDGRLEITLAIARLSKGPRKWKDFQVRAFYRPVVQGRSVDLMRDGIVQLSGPRMNAGAQLALRGVFLKVFSQKEPVHATPESFVKNPKLNGVAVTQFVIDDGWIGAAIGRPRTVVTQADTTQR